MTDLERLLPDDLLRKLRRKSLWSNAELRQSLAPAFEQAKEEGRLEAQTAQTRCVFCGRSGCIMLHDGEDDAEAPPAAAAPEQTPVVLGVDWGKGDSWTAEVVPSPAVPEQAETPPEDIDCGHAYAGNQRRRAEAAESRCRQVEAERNQAYETIAGIDFALNGEQRGRVSQTSLAARQLVAALTTVTAELTEARSARERAERVLMQVDAAWVDLDMAIRPNRVGDVLTPWGLGARHVLDKLRAALTPPVPPSATPEQNPR